MSDFPVLDAPRTIANAEFDRVVIDDTLAPLKPYIEEIDWWVTMPVRLVFNQCAAVHIEIGPYSMSGSDIQRLRAALAAYDRARGINNE